MRADAVTRALVYARSQIDRAALRRRDERWLAARRRDPGSKVVLLAGLMPLVEDEPIPRLALVPLAAFARELDEDAMFLGEDADGAAVFALPLADAIDAEPGRFVELRSVGAVLPAADAGLAAYARGLAFWHARNRFCGMCGAPTRPVSGGHARRCTACGLEHFPRTDPAVIVLVTRGEQCLLGRSARFVAGMYSTLAGFVEPGESLEDAVAREVFEESGIRVAAVTYRASQPWPFPASLMIGFRAEALDASISFDDEELVDAAWFERAVLADPARCPIRLPGPDSIARRLIDDWLAEANRPA